MTHTNPTLKRYAVKYRYPNDETVHTQHVLAHNSQDAIEVLDHEVEWLISVNEVPQ